MVMSPISFSGFDSRDFKQIKVVLVNLLVLGKNTQVSRGEFKWVSRV